VLWGYAKQKFELRLKIQELKRKIPADFGPHVKTYKGKDPLREINKTQLDKLETKLNKLLDGEAAERKRIRNELAVLRKTEGLFSGSIVKSAWTLPPGVKVPLSEDEKWRNEQIDFWLEQLVTEGA